MERGEGGAEGVAAQRKVALSTNLSSNYSMSQALYDRIGFGYSEYRRPDKRIAGRIDGALGRSRSVLNVGAGTGSYEPNSRLVIAIEPSAEMIRQRSRMAAQSIQASADRLPFRDCSFDAALAILTIHHWSNRDQGLAEMRRVARDRMVIFTWDPEHPGFWLVQDYLPEILAIDRPNFPSVATSRRRLVQPTYSHSRFQRIAPTASSVRTGAARRCTSTRARVGPSRLSPKSIRLSGSHGCGVILTMGRE